MTRKISLFAALFFVALVAGAAFAIWIDYNPSGMSPTFYVEKMQHAIRVFTIPLPVVVVLGALFSIVSAFFARRDRPDFFLLVAASVCLVAVALITAFGNIPINNEIQTWKINSPPANWSELSEKWWQFQILRTIAAVVGLSLLILAALVGRATDTKA